MKGLDNHILATPEDEERFICCRCREPGDGIICWNCAAASAEQLKTPPPVANPKPTKRKRLKRTPPTRQKWCPGCEDYFMPVHDQCETHCPSCGAWEGPNA